MDTVADIWKIKGILAMAHAVPYAEFRIAGLARPESKTANFMRRVGYTRRDVFDKFASLTFRNYAQGPLPDDKGRPLDLWVFGSYIAALETYIKFGLYFKEQDLRCLCVSFHEAAYPLVYPYERQAS